LSIECDELLFGGGASLKWLNKPWARSMLDPDAGRWVDWEYKMSDSRGRACHCRRLLKFGEIIEMSAGVAMDDRVEDELVAVERVWFWDEVDTMPVDDVDEEEVVKQAVDCCSASLTLFFFVGPIVAQIPK